MKKYLINHAEKEALTNLLGKMEGNLSFDGMLFLKNLQEFVENKAEPAIPDPAIPQE